MALLDVDTLKASKNQTQDIEAAITALKKDNDYLFQQPTVPRVVSSTTGINNDAQTKKNRQTKHLEACSEKENKECQ